MGPAPPSLTVAVSTRGARALGLEARAWPAAPGVDFLVLVQEPDADPRLGPALDRLAARPDVTVLRLATTGLARSRNAALDAARGELLLIADDDVDPPAGRLRRHPPLLRREPAARPLRRPLARPRRPAAQAPPAPPPAADPAERRPRLEPRDRAPPRVRCAPRGSASTRASASAPAPRRPRRGVCLPRRRASPPGSPACTTRCRSACTRTRARASSGRARRRPGRGRWSSPGSSAAPPPRSASPSR